MDICFSNRITGLPPYLFAEIDSLKNKLIKEGREVIDLGVGDPDLSASNKILETLNAAANDSKNHRYPSYKGLFELREAISCFMEKRFKVKLNADSEITALIGSKEGIGHFPMAVINHGDYVICPDPCYPVYIAGASFAGGEVYSVPLLEENKFLPHLKSIPESIREKSKIIWVNYPNNPTSAVATKDFFKELVEFAHKNNIIICHDSAYSEIYMGDKPLSILEIDGGKEVAIEFHSFSKTFNMTGFRIGFACGNEKLISALGKVKTNLDSGQFQAIEYAAVTALKNYEEITDRINDIYHERRKIVVDGLKNSLVHPYPSNATFYVWSNVPDGFTSKDYCKFLLEQEGIVVTPGIGFGKGGEGYFRIALTQNSQILKEAVSRISKIKI